MASIDIRELEKNKRVAKKLLKRLRKISPDSSNFNLGMEIFKIIGITLLFFFSYYVGYLTAPHTVEYIEVEVPKIIEVPRYIDLPLDNEKCIKVEAEDGSYMIRCEIKNVEERRNE